MVTEKSSNRVANTTATAAADDTVGDGTDLSPVIVLLGQLGFAPKHSATSAALNLPGDVSRHPSSQISGRMRRIGSSISSRRHRDRRRRRALGRGQLITISTFRRHHTRTKRKRSSLNSSNTTRRMTSLRAGRHSQDGRNITRRITHGSSTLKRTNTSNNTCVILVRFLSRKNSSSTNRLSNSERTRQRHKRNRSHRVFAKVRTRQRRLAHAQRRNRLSLRRMGRRRTRPRKQNDSNSSKGRASSLVSPHIAMGNNRRARGRQGRRNSSRHSRHRLRHSQRDDHSTKERKVLIRTMCTRITLRRTTRVQRRLLTPQSIRTRLITMYHGLLNHNIFTRDQSHKIMLKRQRRRRRRRGSTRYRGQRKCRSSSRRAGWVTKSVCSSSK